MAWGTRLHRREIKKKTQFLLRCPSPSSGAGAPSALPQPRPLGAPGRHPAESPQEAITFYSHREAPFFGSQVTCDLIRNTRRRESRGRWPPGSQGRVRESCQLCHPAGALPKQPRTSGPSGGPPSLLRPLEGAPAPFLPVRRSSGPVAAPEVDLLVHASR